MAAEIFQMRPRRGGPLQIEPRGRGRQQQQQYDPFAEIQLSKILKELSFIRIQIDEITMSQRNSLIEKLYNGRQLYGFQLEYSFPCLETVSKALRSTVRIPEKSATMNRIEFKHKRVVLLTMHEDQIPIWQRAKLNIHLFVQMETLGKFTTRPLATCSIPLYELLIAPYMICRDFEFNGAEFKGTALVKIDLGTRTKVLMEKLEALRGETENTTADGTFVVLPGGRRTRSRSSSRCYSRHGSGSGGENQNRPPRIESNNVEMVELGEGEMRRSASVAERYNADYDYTRRPFSSRSVTSVPMYDRNMAASTSSMGSDSVFQSSDIMRKPSHPSEFSAVPDRMVRQSVTEEIILEGKCYIQLTVHEATGLPPVDDENGRIVSPNAYVSVLGREGELRSEIVHRTRQPRWNWTARFAMSSERRNLVVKVLHRGVDSDKPLGFVTLSLPINNVRKAVFEMTDVSKMNKFTSEVPMLVMSIEKVELEPDVVETCSVGSSSRRRHQSTQSSPRIEILDNSPRIHESREQIIERLRKNMEELGSMMQNIRK